jgi:3D (Asp-Asp-Asp) domain-containing protein
MFPGVPKPDTVADSVSTDTVSSARDTAAVAEPFDALPKTRLPAALVPKGRLFRSIEERARAGERVAVSVTAYCLQGRTRRDNFVRDGIIAVDRKLFPLGREVDLYFGRTLYGRFLADDTGGAIKGGRIDVWMGDCAAARRFGRKRGYAQLVPRAK